MNSIVAIIQATYMASFFPGRVLAPLADKTVLEYICLRIKELSFPEDIILATSELPEDDTISNAAMLLGMKVYRGSKYDVIGRLANAAMLSPCETILKVNGNYPLFDPHLAERMIADHINNDFDFSYNEHDKGTVYGTGCEVIRKSTFIALNNEQLTMEQRESGTLYFHQNKHRYRTQMPVYSNPRPHYKVCFDTQKDLSLIEFILKNLKRPYTDEIIELLDNNPILAQSNKYETVREVGVEKIMLFPEKIAAINDIRENSAPDMTYPISVELSLTHRCNFNCVWCSDSALRARHEDGLTLETLDNLFKDLRDGGTKGIVIEGGGEPTLYKYFSDVVNMASDYGFGVGVITNGSTAIERSIADRCEWIRVSLDASNSEEHRVLKNTTSFEKVMSNIKDLCQSKAAIGIGYVVTSRNINNLDALILRLYEFGVKYIQFRPVIDHPEMDVDVDISYLKRYESNKFSVIIDGMDENVIEGNDGLPCSANSVTSVISADGGVYLCGRLNIHDWIEPIGNITTESFHDIWNGQERIRQSAQLLDPDFCKKNCPRCRLTKFNQLFGRLGRIQTKNFI